MKGIANKIIKLKSYTLFKTLDILKNRCTPS